MRKTIIIAFIFFLGSVSLLNADEMRKFNPIRTPVRVAALVPTGFELLPKVLPIDRDQVISAMNKLFENWRGPQLMKFLSKDFFDRDILKDSMNNPVKVPPNAKIRVLSFQRLQTIQQMVGEDEQYGSVVISIVLVTAKTQIEFNDVNEGFVRLEGVNDYILEIKEKIQ